jgi:hypothetical protein
LGTAVGIEDHRPVEALGLHFLQVAGDCFLGDIAVEPPPETADAGAVWRTAKTRFEIGGPERMVAVGFRGALAPISVLRAGVCAKEGTARMSQAVRRTSGFMGCWIY